MIPVIFINCKSQPFVRRIMDGTKEFETRSRNTLGHFLGEKVLLAETGNGKPLVLCSAVISEYVEVFTAGEWNKYRDRFGIDPGSQYDWQEGTKKKVLYRLTKVTPINPFRLSSSARRHGRTWAEYDEAKTQ